MEYRVSFLLQMIGMITNDLGWLAVWLMVFARFPNLNGWTSNELIIFQSVTALAWGLVYFFASGADMISTYITEGTMDHFLTFPKNLLWHISISETYVSSLSDIIFALGLFAFSKDVSITGYLILITVGVLAALVAYSFMVIANTLTFFFGNFKQGAWSLINAFAHLTDSPQSVYKGGLKFISIFILPAFFVGMVPVTLIKSFTLGQFGLLILAVLAILFIAIKFFYFGLKRYESGNLININL